MNTEAIRALVPLASRLETLGIDLDGSGTAPCPKGCSPDHRRAFYVVAGRFWACRHCHPEHGDVIALERWLTGATFNAACRALVESGGGMAALSTVVHAPREKGIREPGADWKREAGRLAQDAADALEESPHAHRQRDYLASRGISVEAARWYCVGAVRDPYGRRGISIPHIREPGRTVAIKVRHLDADGDQRFGAERGSAPRLFGEHLAQGGDLLIATEGEMNCLALWMAVGKGGGTDVVSFAAEDRWPLVAELAPKYARVLVWLDRDEKAREAAEGLRHPSLAVVASPRGLDANDILRAHGEEGLRRFVEAKVGGSLRARESGLVN